MKLKIQYGLLLLMISIQFGCTSCSMNRQKVSKVEIRYENDTYQMYCNNEPIFLKGAGVDGGNIKALAAHGGNVIRTWRPDSRVRTGKQLLDEAKENGLMVCMGLEIGRERHGFDYNDSISVQQQFNRIKEEVLKYKDHPAILAWGIGNELNLRYKNPKVWDAVNDIAEMIHELDPNHPTTTMLAGIGKHEVAYIMEHCSALDFLCFQIYGDIMNLPRYIQESGWDGPYVVSEWGVTGHWEVPKTAWGRPIEQTSTEKARDYKNRYEQVIANDKKRCLGSFVFLWGQKQERTPTWYGLFLESGEHTEVVDVMQYVWTGHWPENRSPKLSSFTINGKDAYQNISLHKGSEITAEVLASDPENNKLIYKWEILPEVPTNKQSDGGDYEERPTTLLFNDTNPNQHTTVFKVPSFSGDYRLFVYVYDNHGNAATANIPFTVIEK